RSSWRDGAWHGGRYAERHAGCRSRPTLRCRPLRAQPGSAGHPGWQLRSDAADERRRGQSQDPEATAPDLRDGNYRTLSPAGELGRGIPDRNARAQVPLGEPIPVKISADVGPMADRIVQRGEL